MALEDTSVDEGENTYKQFYCQPEKAEGVKHNLIFLAALNIFLSVTAILGNTLILVALHKISSVRSASKLLYRNLATTDLFVGITAQPLMVVHWISAEKGQWHICRSAKMANFLAGYILCSVSLITMTVISVDRLLALLLGLRYKHDVTLKRTYLAISIAWAVSILLTAMYFVHYRITLWYSYVGIILALLILTFCYAKIILTLRHRQRKVFVTPTYYSYQGQVKRPGLANITRYKKTLSGALWLQMILLVCYLPYCIVDALISQRRDYSQSFYIAREFTVTLVYLNSSLNPIVYCWKMREVKRAVKETLKQIFSCICCN